MIRPAPVADWVTFSDLQRDPFAVCARLRAEGGIHWVPSVGRYLITSYEAVRATDFDQATFSVSFSNSRAHRAIGRSMLRLDDPEHHHVRRIWQGPFRPNAVARTWSGAFERNAERYLGELIARGPGTELIEHFAAPYAAENLREILGFLNSTQQDLQRWSQCFVDATGNYLEDPAIWARAERASTEVDDALDDMLIWHGTHPDQSLISMLAYETKNDLSIEQIRANVKLTIAAGLNEPRDALGIATWALLNHPDQLRAVDEDSSVWPLVFDEAIRWNSPIGIYTRQVTRDTVLAGVALPAGAHLAICIHSANRDDSVWPNASSFDIQREVRPHLAFGKGVHACLGAWVARTQVAGVALPMLFNRLRGLALDPEQPAEIDGWSFRGMRRLPVTWSHAQSRTAEARTESTGCPAAAHAQARPLAPSIAIVGAGPSGCFTAQALRRAFPDASIDVFERLPVPYGLVRYGVAPDHQGTKSVTRQFERVFTHDGVTFHGNVEVGIDVDLADLRAAFDAVILATGLHQDAELDIPGTDLAGVIGAGRLTRALNGYPDAALLRPLGREVVVIGHGNVAIDVVRLLTRDADGFAGSDVHDEVRERLVRDVQLIHVVGRSQPAAAKFDAVLVRELATLPGISHWVYGLTACDTPAGKDARIDALRQLKPRSPGETRVQVEWWFGQTPTEIEGGAFDRAGYWHPAPDSATTDAIAHVHAVRLADTRGVRTRLTADAVVTAIGFAPDDETPVVPGAHPTGRVETGLYVAGWLRRGPRGTIPNQREDARRLARLLSEDLTSGALTAKKPGRVALGELPDVVDFDGWRRIDRHEISTAAPDRVRAKLHSRAELFAAARDDSIELLPIEPAPLARLAFAGGQPVTIAYGTESGTAELVAEELRRSLEDDPRVDVIDLADLSPSQLDPDRLHILICSTYGDGELPTTARAFHDALVTERPNLAGLRFAMFGLGDRSYAATYSRGSELLDETLTSLGATRIGEYGRHDAGGPEDVTERAADWLAGVLAEANAAASGAHQPN